MSAIATVIMAAIATLGLFGGIFVWVYKRGGDERAVSDTLKLLKESLDNNTKANQDVVTELRDFKVDMMEKVHEMDIRLTKGGL